jgi:hypothetical protein
MAKKQVLTFLQKEVYRTLLSVLKDPVPIANGPFVNISAANGLVSIIPGDSFVQPGYRVIYLHVTNAQGVVTYNGFNLYDQLLEVVTTFLNSQEPTVSYVDPIASASNGMTNMQMLQAVVLDTKQGMTNQVKAIADSQEHLFQNIETDEDLDKAVQLLYNETWTPEKLQTRLAEVSRVPADILGIEKGREMGMTDTHLHALSQGLTWDESVEKIISFHDLIMYGIANDANMVNGLPWSFTYEGFGITHHTDTEYHISTSSGLLKIHSGEYFHIPLGAAPYVKPSPLVSKVRVPTEVSATVNGLELGGFVEK